MSTSAAPPLKVIWTIGHWVCSTTDFVETLHHAGIELLVDVRAQPGSRRSPQFDQDELPKWLGPAGIDYIHISSLSGRRPKQRHVPEELNAGWQNASFKNYADYTTTDPYREGLRELIELASVRATCVMCGEPMPWRCHRSLIANSLVSQGWTVWHLSTTSKPKQHHLGAWGATPLLHPDHTLTYPADPLEVPETSETLTRKGAS